MHIELDLDCLDGGLYALERCDNCILTDMDDAVTDDGLDFDGLDVGDIVIKGLDVHVSIVNQCPFRVNIEHLDDEQVCVGACCVILWSGDGDTFSPWIFLLWSPFWEKAKKLCRELPACLVVVSIFPELI